MSLERKETTSYAEHAKRLYFETNTRWERHYWSTSSRHLLSGLEIILKHHIFQALDGQVSFTILFYNFFGTSITSHLIERGCLIGGYKVHGQEPITWSDQLPY